MKRDEAALELLAWYKHYKNKKYLEGESPKEGESMLFKKSRNKLVKINYREF
jgi:hypothetical protein